MYKIFTFLLFLFVSNFCFAEYSDEETRPPNKCETLNVSFRKHTENYYKNYDSTKAVSNASRLARTMQDQIKACLSLDFMMDNQQNDVRFLLKNAYAKYDAVIDKANTYKSMVFDDVTDTAKSAMNGEILSTVGNALIGKTKGQFFRLELNKLLKDATVSLEEALDSIEWV